MSGAKPTLSRVLDWLLVLASATLLHCPEPETDPIREQGPPHPDCALEPATEDAIPIQMIEAGWSKPVALPAPVNSACPEDCPEISPDGTSLYFCWTDQVYANDMADEDWANYLYSSWNGTYRSDWNGARWSEPEYQYLGKGTEWSVDMAASRTADGGQIVFHSIRDANEAFVEVYRASRTGDGWTEAERLPAVINDGMDAGEAGVSPEGDVIVFASARAGGYGGNDLWASFFDGKSWQEAVNLGPAVNTEADEAQAFIRADGAELYFSRGGLHPGISRAPHIDPGNWGPSAWGQPVWVVSGAVGEASVTTDGSMLVFVHVFVASDGRLLDADIFSSQQEQ